LQFIKNALAAISVASVKNSFKQANLSVPGEPFEFVGNSPRTAFMILPGHDGPTLQPGTLEDLCLSIVKDRSIFNCVDAYMECLKSNGTNITRPHKTKLHSYLAGKNDFVGMKIGEAATAGAWDWGDDRLKEFKDVIVAM
jgi:hypothetical protein